MELQDLLTPEIIIPVLIGALISWYLAKRYSVSSLDEKVSQAYRYKRAGFGQSTATKSDSSDRVVETPIGEFIVSSQGFVTDVARGLMWVQAPWGMEWNGNYFTGEPLKLTWWDATSLFGKGVSLPFPVGALNIEHLEASKIDNGFQRGKCEVSFAGFKDWRLPTAYELNTLALYESASDQQYQVDREAVRTLRESVFPNLAELTGGYWMWCAHEQGAGMAWATDGSWPPGDFKAATKMSVLLVRTL